MQGVPKGPSRSLWLPGVIHSYVIQEKGTRAPLGSRSKKIGR